MEKRLSKKQRHNYYKQALQINQERVDSNLLFDLGVCNLLGLILFNHLSDFDKVDLRLFPEFELFRPESHGNYWFTDISGGSKDNNDIRQLVLMFCIEMTR